MSSIQERISVRLSGLCPEPFRKQGMCRCANVETGEDKYGQIVALSLRDEAANDPQGRTAQCHDAARGNERTPIRPAMRSGGAPSPVRNDSLVGFQFRIGVGDGNTPPG